MHMREHEKVCGQREEQLEDLQEQRQRQMDDDFVLCFIKANRMHKYRRQLHYEPDFEYILHNYRFEKEEWLSIVKKFKRQILNLLFSCFKRVCDGFAVIIVPEELEVAVTSQLDPEMVTHLLVNGALTINDAADLLHILFEPGMHVYYKIAILSHLLDKNYKIKAEWVASAINIDELVDRMKATQTFTFGDVHKARQWNAFSPFNINAIRTFYKHLQKHFLNPEFENPFDEWLETQHAHGNDGQTQRFVYDVGGDALKMVAHDGKNPGTHSMLGCANMMEKSLSDVIGAYMEAVEIYGDLNEELESMKHRLVNDNEDFLDMERFYVGGEREDEDEDENAYDYTTQEEVDEKASERNAHGLEVSKLYFVISTK